MDSLIPPSKISGLSQGMFVGAVSDNFGERIEQKIFHAEIVVDSKKVKAEEEDYKTLPIVNTFLNDEGKDCMDEVIQLNYRAIKEQVKMIVLEEKARLGMK